MSIYSGFGLAGPPRGVPLLVGLRVLFGGVLSQMGWFFFGFGMIFVWVFTLSSDLTGWYVFRGALEKAEGRITASRKTRMSVNDTPVWEYSYQFTAADGRSYEGKSYKTGGGERTGRAVQVEYRNGRPEASRIEGMRRGTVGLIGVFPVLFPAVGLAMVAGSARKGLKGLRLLREGHSAKGRLVGKEATNTKINEQVVYRMTFEFEAYDGRTYEAEARTHVPGVLEDEAEEPLLYDPADPSCAVMLDDLPGSPRIDEHGQIRCAAAPLAFASVLIPAVSILGHVTYAVMRFGGR